MKRFMVLLALAAALAVSHAFAQTASRHPESRLDLFIHALRSPADGSVIPQSKLEQVLLSVTPVGAGHGGDAPLIQNSTAAVASSSSYGFCYEACRTERAVASCGTPGPGDVRPPTQLCRPIEF